MKFDTVIVRDSEGERRYSRDQLPLRLGTGIHCEIRLPGPGNAPVAMLDNLDDESFIQPVGNSALLINAEPLASARRLADGDSLGFYGSRVEVSARDGAMLLQVRLEESQYMTRPPQEADSVTASDEMIAPTAFRRAADIRAQAAPAKSYRWQSYVAAGMAALLLVSWLLFTAKSLQFEIEPSQPDDFSISGGWFRMPFGDRVLMREGSYTVHVRKQGYYDVDQALQVDDTPSRTVRVSMRKLPGRLVVITDPAVSAVVTVDGTEVGQAPFGPIVLEPGTHSIAVSADRYLPFADRISVPGLDLQQEVFVQLVPQWANVNVQSEPAGATVYREQEVLGRTPLRIELLEGTHSLSVIADGFKPWDGSVSTTPNRDLDLPLIRLEPANARLTVRSIPSGANVTVDGRYRGQSPLTLSLSPDTNYQIGLTKAGYGSTVRRVRLQAAAADAITVDLSARVGKVTVNVLPLAASVFVDGVARGSGNMVLDLSSAPHTLEVRMPGYQTFSRSITPRPGYPQTLQVRLLTDEEVAAQGVANTLETSAGQSMRRVEPGGFVLGTSRREQGRRANEVLVPTTLTRPFFIGTREVTNREFLKFRKSHISGEGVHPSLAGDLNPVVNISWEDAVEYCNWLSTQEGLPLAYEKKFEKWQPIQPTPDGYRLPTEAEWEWAIRYQARSTATVFPWGNSLPPRADSGNYADKSAIELVPSIIPNFNDGFASTAPPGSFPANALGIYDGGGNVAEWVQDYYSVSNPGQADPVVDPQGPARGNNRVIRGSSWRHAGITELRYGYRDFGTSGRIDVGFRLARNAN